MEDTGWNRLLPSKGWMRFRDWERTQLWRFYTGGGDIVEGRRLRQLPPSCQPRSLRGLTRLYSCGVQPGSRPLPDSRPTPGALEQGRGRGQAGRSPGGTPRLPRVFRIPECPSLRRALQALPTNWLSKEVCGFSFSSLSPSLPLSDKDKLAKDAVPGGGGACSATEDFHQYYLSRSAAR